MKLLIVCPHWAPANAPDGHRVRMLLPYLAALGCEIDVLALRAQDLSYPIDPLLDEPAPTGVTIHRLEMPAGGLLQRLGIRATGLRAWRTFAQAGSNLIASREHDLVLFSTTAFPLLTLARRWKKHHGVRIAFDFQDPWVPPPGIPIRRGAKHAIMRWIHRFLEPRAVSACDALVAVSAGYIQMLRDRYADLRAVPSLELPFCVSKRDLEAAEGLTVEQYDGLFVGGVSEGIRPVALLVCRAIEQLRRQGVDVSLHLVGTDYAQRTPQVLPLLESTDSEQSIAEQPQRVGFFTSIAMAKTARFVVVLGSTEPDFVPSKLYNAFASASRLLLVLPKGSPLCDQFGERPGFRVAVFADPNSVQARETVASAIRELILSGPMRESLVPESRWADAQARELVDFLRAG